MMQAFAFNIGAPPDPKRFRRLGSFLRRSLDDEARRSAAQLAKLSRVASQAAWIRVRRLDYRGRSAHHDFRGH